jgi:hypothetical protein
VLEVAASKLLLGLISSGDVSGFAADALADGCDSPSLRLLAGSTGIQDDEVRFLLAQALTETDSPALKSHAAVVRLAREISMQLLRGNLSAYDGAKQIWELTLRVPEEHFPELDSFVYAASEWAERPKDRKLFNEGIVAAAKELLIV